MTEKILIVDDDPNILKAYERRLRKRFQIETALCSEEGVTAVNFLGPFSVIVSDMMMPRENGAEFLARMLEQSPESVRIMLTGNADQNTAAAAINQGRVFKFLNKPCEAETLESAIEEGIQEYRRGRAERELLSQTVMGTVDLLAKVLALTSPEVFGRGSRLKVIVSEIASAAEWNDAWRHEATALLSQIGYVAVPAPVVQKFFAGEEISGKEAESLASHPQVAGELISAIPRLESIANVIAAQDQENLGVDAEEDLEGPRSSVAFGVRLLRLAIDYDQFIHEEKLTGSQALQRLEASADKYDDECFEALRKAVAAREARLLVAVGVHELRDGMHLVQDVTTVDGALLISKGQDVTPSLRHRLVNYSSTHEIFEPIEALAPPELASELKSESEATSSC